MFCLKADKLKTRQYLNSLQTKLHQLLLLRHTTALLALDWPFSAANRAPALLDASGYRKRDDAVIKNPFTFLQLRNKVYATWQTGDRKKQMSLCYVAMKRIHFRVDCPIHQWSLRQKIFRGVLLRGTYISMRLRYFILVVIDQSRAVVEGNFKKRTHSRCRWRKLAISLG